VTFPKIEFHVHLEGYAAEAAGHGAVYLEGIFSPAEPAARGVPWDEIFTGYCDGAQEARERHGVPVRLTPDITRGLPLAAARRTAEHAVAYAGRGIVLDVGPASNLATGVVTELARHPLPALVAAGVQCSLSTDDPAMFGTGLGIEYQVAAQLGVDPRACYDAGAAGALCDAATRELLRTTGQNAAWPPAPVPAGKSS
jgi:adenosine deaminase